MAYLTMRSDTAQKIFAFVVNNQGCYQEQMAETLGVHHDTVRWHISRMEEVGLIKVVREGRKKRHYLDELGMISIVTIGSIARTKITFCAVIVSLILRV